MITGWKNDPRWREYYERLERERNQRFLEMQRIDAEERAIEMDNAMADARALGSVL